MSIPSGFGQYSHLKLNDKSSTISRSHTATPVFSPPPHSIFKSSNNNNNKNQVGVRWGSDQYFSQNKRDDSIMEGDNQSVKSEEDDGQEDEEEELGWKGQGKGKTLAINAARGELGCCYYDGNDGKMYLLLDQQDTSAWDLVTMIVQQINPTIVLTAANADNNFVEVLTEVLSSISTSESNSSSNISNSEIDSNSCQLEYRAPREFFSNLGKQALSNLIITEGGIYNDEIEEEFQEFSRENQENDNSDEDGQEQVEKNAYDFGKKRFKRRNVEMSNDDRGRRNKELRLEGFVNGLDSSPLTLGCAASLMGHINRTISSSGELNHDGQIEVSGLESMNLHEVMCISQDALSSLQIFTAESHATSHSDYKKEGLSLFGILNRAKTPLGRGLMTNWFLRPSLNLDLIHSRHSAVECFLRPENQAAVETILINFTTIKNIGKTMRLLGTGRGGLRDWKAVWSFIYGAVMIRDAVLTFSGRSGISSTNKLIESFDPEDFKELGGMINDVIDWEESALQQGRIIVKPGTNVELDALRRSYDGLPSLLSTVAIQISQEAAREFAESLSIVYFPQLGYLIAIPYKEEVLDPNKFPAEDWQFQFVTETSAYFKSDKCRDLDSHLGDLHSFISDKEIEIVHALLTELMKREQSMIEACSALSELDCLIAFSEAARIYDWNKPAMTNDNVTRIKQFRHPLVELCVDSFVKNDISLVGSKGLNWNVEGEEGSEQLEEGILDPELSMLVVTGANYSGKSVFLKTIAMLTFMAQIGSYIPAEKALIGVADRILTRISTKESISRGSSAFMIDLQQVSFILRNATARSLIIIDEFGKGTESDDGAGLLCGVLEHLINRGNQAPRVAVSTHFQDVFANGLLDSSLPIGLAHMEILLHEPRTSTSNSASSNEATSKTISSASRDITYLYRLAPGITTSSNAAACASLFGIDDEVVNRATEISNLISHFEIATLLNADLTKQEKEELKESEAIVRRFIAIDWTEEEGGMLDLDLNELKQVLTDSVLQEEV